MIFSDYFPHSSHGPEQPHLTRVLPPDTYYSSEFTEALDIHKADTVLWCESNVCNAMYTYEFIPKNYTIFCWDHNVDEGGVFVATTDRIMSYEIPDIDTDCEIVRAELNFLGSKPLFLASFYYLHNTTSHPLDTLSYS